MDSVEKIQNELIDKILTIKNKGFLKALSNLISSTEESNEVVKLSAIQKEILELSEVDIKNGDLISQEAMDKSNR
jgi:hypothetical protein